jgi:DNA-binding MarR family transcriptional regulator/N-acetylglutamate synthase-like GNAT family acetyltransferase
LLQALNLLTIATISSVSAIRHFNRFYTQKIGVVEEKVYDRPWSLTEARVLYELASRAGVTAAQLATDLGLDPGYLSRVLSRFETRKLLRRATRSDDRRKSVLTLTEKGKQEFARIDKRSSDQIAEMIEELSPAHQQQIVTSMQTIESLLEPSSGGEAYILRPPNPGDYGWVIQRHGAIYAAEFGWSEEFEALVAEIMVHFIRRFDPRRERAWIAERDGQNAGCVFLVKKSERVAQLRCLLVEPTARGLGIGARLVEECIRFAEQHGYKKMILWTNDILHAARHIYEQCGFKLVEEKKHRSFGHDLVGQTWELHLTHSAS